jgi:hypothetical protein
MKRRSPADGLVKKPLKINKPLEVVEEKPEEVKPEEVKPEEVKPEEVKPEEVDRLDNIKKEVIEKLIKKQSEEDKDFVDKPKHKKKKKVVYVSESDDDEEK